MKRKRSRRGITPVIAIILLLLMTVAAAGAAFLWITKFQSMVGQQMNKQLSDQQRCQLIQMSVDDVWANDPADPQDDADNMMIFTLRNAGSINLREDEWEAISVTGGIDQKKRFTSTTLEGTPGQAVEQCYVNISTNFDAQTTHKVICFGFADDPNWEDNDVYTIIVQPGCGTGSQGSWVYTS